jgi:hypothetical protein
MPITISGKEKEYTFQGLYSSTSSLNDNSGVYAILSARNEHYYLLDVGEAGEVKKRVETHDRKDCWERNMNGGAFRCAVYYTPNLQQEGRRRIEKDIRDNNSTPCGTF